MSNVKPFRLSRRAILRGGATALALPALEAMTTGATGRAFAQPKATSARALFIYFPSGYQRGQWLTGGNGASTAFTLPRIARALDPWKHKLTIVTGLSNNPARIGLNNAGGLHARGTACSLVCRELTGTGFVGDGVSADQVIVKEAGGANCISSLVLGVPNERVPSFPEEGLDSIYYNNISFTGPRSPVQKLNNPADLFLRLTTCPGFGAAPGAKRARFEKRVMSAVKQRAERLMKCVGQADRLRLEEYFTSVAELERRFLPSPATASTCGRLEAPPLPGSTLKEGATAMMDLAVLAFQCGLTNVGTLMMDGAFSRRDFGLPDLGGANDIHGLSHASFSGPELDTPRWMRITAHYFELFAYLLGKLDAQKEGSGTMLDHSIVYIGSEFGDGNAHQVDEQPVIIAGGGGGRLRMGRHIAAPTGTPTANALLDVLHAMGVQRTSFGDSTGGVSGLAAG